MSSDAAAVLVDFPVTIELPVQWGDQDAFGHVNNVIYFRWYESARLAYLERLELIKLESLQHLGPILASTRCDYRRQLSYPDRVTVGVRVERIGGKSLTMQYAVYSQALRGLAAEGESVVVTFNYETDRSEPIPDQMRRAIERLEGRPL